MFWWFLKLTYRDAYFLAFPISSIQIRGYLVITTIQCAVSYHWKSHTRVYMIRTWAYHILTITVWENGAKHSLFFLCLAQNTIIIIIRCIMFIILFFFGVCVLPPIRPIGTSYICAYRTCASVIYLCSGGNPLLGPRGIVRRRRRRRFSSNLNFNYFQTDTVRSGLRRLTCIPLRIRV